MTRKTQTEREREAKVRALVEDVQADFSERQKERKKLERGWELNMNFLCGNQYCGINAAGEIEEEEREYGWQPKRVFNRIAPAVELRCSKLARIRPALAVRALSEDEADKRSAALSAAILAAAGESAGLDSALSSATVWSETCGTAFYKVVWDNGAGKVLGQTEAGENICEGDVKVVPLSPFEIYPYSLSEDSIEAQPSIIHARAVPVQEIYAAYGVKLAGRDIDEFSLSPYSAAQSSGAVRAMRRGYEVVIERYTRPAAELPEGRLTAIAGGVLLYDGPLPYMNGENGGRAYPFVKQTSISLAGSFFGASVVDRMIPVQRAYNAVRNRKHEFLNRISMGTVAVEEGSTDTDDLIEDGLRPGKVIVYRQGSKPPELISLGALPDCFKEEEETLSDEFTKISGMGDLTQNGQSFSSVTSATGLQLLVEQDEARLNVCYESVKQALRCIGRQMLRLYRQFAAEARLIRTPAEGGKMRLTLFKGADILSDEVILESDSDVNLTPAERRNVVYEMIDRGLLSDDEGRMSRHIKNKVLSFIGYGGFADGRDIAHMHAARAAAENEAMRTGEADVKDYDDHAVHIEEHTAFLLSSGCDKSTEERVCAHVKIHKNKWKEEQNG